MKTETDKQKTFSIIVGEHHRQDVHQIAEFMPSRNQYRLKTVSYQFFRSKKDLISFCCKHEIELDHISETHTQRKQNAVEFGKKEHKQEPREPEIVSPEAKAFGLSEKQLKAADVNGDTKINSIDASSILAYYSFLSTTTEAVPMEKFLEENK